MLKMKLIILFNLLLISSSTNNHSIRKRSLLFPRATVLQFTYGVSAPAILPSRSINLSLCLQVNYDLPYNLTRLVNTRIVEAKANEGFDLSRETLYKYIISFLDSFSLDGEECLYRLICEMSEYPMHLDHKENLLEKIVHYLFTPSLEIHENSTESFRNRLLEAETWGQNDAACEKKYSRCFISLVSLFTSKYTI